MRRRGPLLAALVASRIRDGLPAPAFFALAKELGRYPGSDERDWHQVELARVFAKYGG